MAVKIRLTRLGRKKRPYYRVVVIPSQHARGGEVLEIVGTYNPKQENESGFVCNAERIKYWMSVGAQPSEPVRRLLGVAGVLPPVVRTPVEPGVTKKQKKERQV